MNYDQFLSLGAFAVVASITPGPNNLMLVASGANFGIRRTLPHLLGVSLGFMLMIVLVGVGMLRVFEAYPTSYRVLLCLSVAYLFYLAWNIATAVRPEAPELTGAPLTFLQAALFQWANPKAWAMAVPTVSLCAPSHEPHAVLFAAIGFSAFGLPCITLWALAGRQLQRYLASPSRLRAFNLGMAALLLGSLYPMLLK